MRKELSSVFVQISLLAFGPSCEVRVGVGVGVGVGVWVWVKGGYG